MSRLPRFSALALTVTAVAAIVVPALTADAVTSAAVGAGARLHAVPAPPAHPTRADQIQNVDQVKTAIKAYYGDRLDPDTVDPVTGAKDLHTFDPHGSYAREVTGTLDQTTAYLARHRATHGGHDAGHNSTHAKPAIVLDVDDTSLVTYNYEIFSNFVYTPASNGAFVDAGSFPAVPAMPQLVHYATTHGYTLFFLTGRGEAQRAGTAANLTKVGYPSVPADQLYLKDLTKPTYASCYRPAQGKTCTTVQYKSLTRKAIEARGYDIVANVGDQYSDLRGGYADRTVKLPNPMYYLP